MEAIFKTSMGHAGTVSVITNEAGRKALVDHGFVQTDKGVILYTNLHSDGSISIAREPSSAENARRRLVPVKSGVEYRVALGYTTDHDLPLNEVRAPWVLEVVNHEWVDAPTKLLLHRPELCVEPGVRKQRQKKSETPGGKIDLLAVWPDGSQAFARGATAAQIHEVFHNLALKDNVDVGFEKAPT